MHTALIYPPDLHHLFQDQEYHLVLAHLFPHKKYRDFVRTLKGYKILDSGSAEGAPISGRELIEIAWTWEVNEVIVPDVYNGHYRDNLDLAVDFERHIVPDFKYMGAVQGHGIEEVMACLNGFSFLEYITTIGLPRNLNRDNKQDRTFIAQDVIPKWTEGRFESVHCLGCSEWVREVALLSMDGVRGIDTSMPVKLGLDYRYLGGIASYTPSPTTDEYFLADYDLDDLQRGFIERNVELFRTWAATPSGEL